MDLYSEDEARLFLAGWFGRTISGELLEVRPLNKRPGCRPLAQRWASNEPEALGLIRERVEHGDDVYVGALPRVRHGGKEADVGRRVWLWADVDYASAGHATEQPHADRESALQAIKDFPFDPTFHVATGGGFHVWYALDGEPSVDDWRAAMARLCFALRADRSVTDPPRILRVPGTWNHKTGEARPVSALPCSGGPIPIGRFLNLDAPPAEPDARPIERAGAGSVGASRVAASSGRSAASHGDRPFERTKDVPIKDVVEWLGYTTHVEGSKTYSACPAHHGTNQHQMVVGGDRGNVATCFGDCDGQAYTCVDLVAKARGVEVREAVNMIAERFGVEGFKPSSARHVVLAQNVSANDAGGDWQARLKGSQGKAANTFGNIVRVLRTAPEFAGRFRMNLMTDTVELDGAMLSDAAVGKLRCDMEDLYQLRPGPDSMYQAINTIAPALSYHPVRSYLDGLVWDGVPRIKRVPREILGVAEKDCGPLVQRMFRCWFISAVARAKEPGCKVDTVLVLVGPQGYYKSTFFQVLGEPWFLDTAIDLRNKDAYMQLSKAWIYEWPEIEGVTSDRQAGEIKAFLTSRCDTFRPPYGRAVVHHDRGSVIVGTTNEAKFLSDDTGSRRFWVVKVSNKVDLARLREWRDQLWAEASQAYAAREVWWLDTVDEEAREAAADEHVVTDPWEDLIADHVRGRSGVIKTDIILEGPLQRSIGQQTKADARRVAGHSSTARL
jgi:virulence-associated protein E